MKTTMKVFGVLVVLGFFALPQAAEACGRTCKWMPTPENPYCTHCVEDEAATSNCNEFVSCSCRFLVCAWADAGRPQSVLDEIGLSEEPLSCPVPPSAAEEQAWAMIAAT